MSTDPIAPEDEMALAAKLAAGGRQLSRRP